MVRWVNINISEEDRRIFLLEEARTYFSKDDFEKSKSYYDSYLDTYSSNNINQFYKVLDEYIKVITSLKEINISIDDSKCSVLNLTLKNMYCSREFADEVANLRYEMNHHFSYSNSWSGGGIDIDENPAWTLECILKFDYCAIDNVIFLFSNIRNEEKYYEALERNLIKKAIIKKWLGYEEFNFNGYCNRHIKMILYPSIERRVFILEKARQAFNDENFKQAKINYDIYLDSVDYNQFYEVRDEYIKVLVSLKGFNISPDDTRCKTLNDFMQKIHKKLEGGIKLTQDEKNKREQMNIEFYPSKSLHEGWHIDYPSYLDSILRFDYSAINNVAFLFSNVRNEEKYYEALEINLIKKAIIKKWMGVEDDNRYRDFHTPRFSNEDYSENSSYEKYEGAYDFDDDTIDVAFEGDPDNYWNID